MSFETPGIQPEGKLPKFDWKKSKPEGAPSSDTAGPVINDSLYDRSTAEAVAREQELEDRASRARTKWDLSKADQKFGGATAEVRRDFSREKEDRIIHEQIVKSAEEAIALQDSRQNIKESKARRRAMSEQKMSIQKDIRITNEVLSGLSRLPWRDRARKKELQGKLKQLEAQKTRFLYDQAIQRDQGADAENRLRVLEAEFKSTSRWNVLKRKELKAQIADQKQEVNRLAVWKAMQEELPMR